MTYRMTERWLREDLAELRTAKGLTIDKVKDLTGLHKRTIERVERGPDRVSAKSLNLLLAAYGAKTPVANRLRAMQVQAETVAWWDEWHDVDLVLPYAEHCELEDVAERIDHYSPGYFPGLVQSPGYAAHMQQLAHLEHLRTGKTAERFIALRLKRQERRWSRRCAVRMLIDEPVLDPKRGPAREAVEQAEYERVLAEQLDHVRDLEESGMLTTRVIPDMSRAAIPDTFSVFTAAGGRRALCFGGFIEHHAEDEYSLTRAREFFARAWQQATPLYDENGECQWTSKTPGTSGTR